MATGFAAARAGGITSAQDLLAAGDIGRCELLQGTLVMMSSAGFEHGVITQRIAAMLHAHVSARKLGVVTAAETGFLLARGPDTVRAADVAFVAESRLPRGRTVTVHTNSSGTRSVGELDPLVSTAVPGLSVALADLLPPAAGTAGG